MTVMPRLQIIVSNELAERVQAIADAEGITVSQVGRDMLEASVEARETLSDERLGR